MKNFLLFCTLAVAVYGGWSKYRVAKTSDSASQAQSEQPKTAVSTPAPTPKRRLAPDGIFFLRDYASVTTSKGVVGFPPGTQVTAVTDFGKTLLVRCEGFDFKVSNNEVTNDLDVASAILKKDASEQYALYVKGVTENSSVAQAKAKELQREAEDLQRRVAATQSSASRNIASNNPLDRAAYGQTNIFRKHVPHGGDEYVMSANGPITIEEGMREERMQSRMHDFQQTNIDILNGNIMNARNNNPRDPNLTRWDSQLMQLRNAAGQ